MPLAQAIDDAFQNLAVLFDFGQDGRGEVAQWRASEACEVIVQVNGKGIGHGYRLCLMSARAMPACACAWN
jgi:hypothetical protein